MAEPVIVVRDLHKEFVLPQHKLNSVKQLFVNIGHRNIKTRQKVLDGISFEVNKGEFFGVVGRNGSGKSTLLKILAGVYSPSSGIADVHGSLTPFIELGVGFNPELSGRDNVYLNGALLGFSHKEMDAMYDDIVDFAELGEFMDQKLKNYSSGMQVRLAFSIAIRAESDILLIDEVLAVGDENFQKKCFEVFEKLKREGRTIVFISHSMGYIRDFCNRVAVVDNGKLLYVGDTEKAVDLYSKLNSEREDTRIEAENSQRNIEVERLGNGKARIVAHRIFDNNGKESVTLRASEEFTVELEIEFHDNVVNPAVGVMFRKNPQENLFGINSFYENKHFGPHKKGDTIKVTAGGTMPLAGGTYYVTFSVADARTATSYTELDTLNNVSRINVTSRPYWGLLSVKTRIEAEKT